jgi:hypothetical protein
MTPFITEKNEGVRTSSHYVLTGQIHKRKLKQRNASVWSVTAAFKYWLQIHLGELYEVTAESTVDLKNFLPRGTV